MSMLRRLLNPSTMIATVALVAATAGTAVAAGEIITSSSQIQDRVVAQRDLGNPSLRYSVAANGSLITGDMGGSPQHAAGSGRYDLSFSSSDLGPLGLDTCGFAVTPRLDIKKTASGFENRKVRAYVNYARGANTFQVFTFEQTPDGKEIPADAAFDAVLTC